MVFFSFRSVTDHYIGQNYINRQCSAMEKFERILCLFGPWLFMAGKIPGGPIGLSSDEHITLIVDFYTKFSIKAKAWMMHRAQGVTALETKVTPDTPITQVQQKRLTEHERRQVNLIEKAKIGMELSKVNNISFISFILGFQLLVLFCVRSFFLCKTFGFAL